MQEHRGSWKGMSLAEVSRLYSMKNLSLGDMRSHKTIKPYITTVKDGCLYVRYVPEEEKNKKSFYNMIVSHSKAVPNPQKYSVIRDWAKEGKRSVMPKTAKISVFAEVAKNARKTPGPATYKPEAGKDKFVLERTPKICKSTLDKVSITASE